MKIWLCVLCVWMSVYLGLDNTAFVFLKNPCHSLPVSPLRLVLMWWYLIWHPSTLPHNPLALQETEILQPLLSVCTLLFPLGSWSGGCPSITMPEWMSGDGSFYLLRHRGLSEMIGDICRTHTACFEGVYFFHNIDVKLGSSSFVAVEKKVVLFWSLIAWYHLLWSDMIEHVTSPILYLCLPFSRLWYNRQFSFPISGKNLCSGLILLMPKSDYEL